MIRLITTARLALLTQAADDAATATTIAAVATSFAKTATADTERVEDAYRRLAADCVTDREEAERLAGDVRLAAFDMVAALIDDLLDDDERRQQIARLLVARRELLGLDAMPRVIWRHVVDIARKDGESDEAPAEGGDTPTDAAPLTLAS
ncbi:MULTISPECIES: hypothetical protein [unclassified Streptomyces]|uniref:hypothetical protein n=1 Tax=unclassified Streptomyces TaxID=2593676 RepID=UPI00226FD289|nr:MULTISPECIES: hypothetical protein [unclassified Streptomyces]MCY0923575.1 hypothetical protein [Streptomyces sp. H27-G5]MCY0962024.1 hypothetical protein [Streptomyces sp. H27-H5]